MTDAIESSEGCDTARTAYASDSGTLTLAMSVVCVRAAAPSNRRRLPAGSDKDASKRR